MVQPTNYTIIVDNDVCTSETMDIQSYGNESIARGMIFDWDEKLQVKCGKKNNSCSKHDHFTYI